MNASVVAVCLAVDPGTTRHAFALLWLLSTGHILVREVWYVELGAGGISARNVLLCLRPGEGRPAGFFAVETIDGVIYKGRDPRQIHLTKANEGRLKLLAEQMGIRFVETRAPVWRKILLGSGTASDEQVRAGVEGLYRDQVGVVHLPAMGSIEREHCLDAVGLGYVELTRVASEGVVIGRDIAERAKRLLSFPGALLPAKVGAEVVRIRMAEEATRNAKRVAKACGLPTERKGRRRQTRADAFASKVKAQTTRFLKKLHDG